MLTEWFMIWFFLFWLIEWIWYEKLSLFLMHVATWSLLVVRGVMWFSWKDIRNIIKVLIISKNNGLFEGITHVDFVVGRYDTISSGSMWWISKCVLSVILRVRGIKNKKIKLKNQKRDLFLKKSTSIIYGITASEKGWWRGDSIVAKRQGTGPRVWSGVRDWFANKFWGMESPDSDCFERFF